MERKGSPSPSASLGQSRIAAPGMASFIFRGILPESPKKAIRIGLCTEHIHNKNRSEEIFIYRVTDLIVAREVQCFSTRRGSGSAGQARRHAMRKKTMD